MENGTLLDKISFMLFRFSIVRNFWAKKYKGFFFDHSPWTKLAKPLPDCKIVLISTGGIMLKSDKAFDLKDPNGDSTFRRIPHDINSEDLTIYHRYYDHKDADLDPNLVLPFEVLRELQEEGLVGPSNIFHYSFMGHILEPHLTTLINESAIDVANEILQQQVDIALLVPA